MSDSQSTGLVDRVYREILGTIVKSGFAEGQKLPTEQALAENFSASRPTIREALSRLRADGIIATRQGSGTVIVRRPDPDLPRFAPLETISDIQRCYEFRIVTEPGAAALAATMADATDLADIERRYRLLDAVISEQALGASEDFEFHLAIARATKNQFFTSVIASMQTQVLFSMDLMRSMSRFKSSDRQQLVQNEHKLIVKALKKRDADGASNAMKEHLVRARDRMFGA